MVERIINMKKLPNEVSEPKVLLTASQIYNKDMPVTKKGYDVYEVDELLDAISQDYNTFEEHFTNAQNYIAQLEAQIAQAGGQLPHQKITINDLDKRLQRDIILFEKSMKKKIQSTEN